MMNDYNIIFIIQEIFYWKHWLFKHWSFEFVNFVIIEH